MGLVLGLVLPLAVGGAWLAWMLFREGWRQKETFHRPNAAAFYYILAWLCAGAAAAGVCFAWRIFRAFLF